MIVLDRSGSIFDDPAAAATASQALAHLVDLLPADQRVGLVTTGSGTPVVERELSALGDKTEIRDLLQSDFTEDVGGNETLVAGVSKALDLLKGEHGTVVLLADGDPGGSAEPPPRRAAAAPHNERRSGGGDRRRIRDRPDVSPAVRERRELALHRGSHT